MIERFFESLNYEQLYRHDIADGLAGHVDDYLNTYNRIRRHEAVDWQRPVDRYLTAPTPSNAQPPKPEQET